MFQSSTRDIPATCSIPKHVAIIMDGNGRWAQKRHLPRLTGHLKGVDAVRSCVRSCVERGIEYLTLFAFSSENWRRPKEEVSYLMRLFNLALEREVARMQENNIRLRVVGDLTAFDEVLQQKIIKAQKFTELNTALTLTVAANYGGRWDILQAVRKIIAEHPAIHPQELTEQLLTSYMVMANYPEPDLFIRTGGEQRISNFLLWQLAYTELYFTDTPWPDFGPRQLDEAIKSYQQRERRFGRTSAQLAPESVTGELP